MSNPGPTRQQDGLKDVVEMLLDKGVVINADIAVSVGETELLGIRLRAALASFETAAQYGLEFPSGTDMRRVEEAAGVRGAIRGTSRGADEATGGENPDADDEARAHGRPAESGLSSRVVVEDPTADPTEGADDEDGDEGETSDENAEHDDEGAETVEVEATSESDSDGEGEDG
jgi:hypothetical protein